MASSIQLLQKPLFDEQDSDDESEYEGASDISEFDLDFMGQDDIDQDNIANEEEDDYVTV